MDITVTTSDIIANGTDGFKYEIGLLTLIVDAYGDPDEPLKQLTDVNISLDCQGCLPISAAMLLRTRPGRCLICGMKRTSPRFRLEVGETGCRRACLYCRQRGSRVGLFTGQRRCVRPASGLCNRREGYEQLVSLALCAGTYDPALSSLGTPHCET